jgi:hypothetical protein
MDPTRPVRRMSFRHAGTPSACPASEDGAPQFPRQGRRGRMPPAHLNPVHLERPLGRAIERTVETWDKSGNGACWKPDCTIWSPTWVDCVDVVTKKHFFPSSWHRVPRSGTGQWRATFHGSSPA